MKVRHNYNGFKGGYAKFTKFNFFLNHETMIWSLYV